MASDRHLLETLQQKVFKVRRTENDPYEWLGGSVTYQSVSASRRSKLYAFSRAAMTGSCSPDRANPVVRMIML
jgi:hypothetical protein